MRWATALLVVAGLLVVLGAQAPWVGCSMEPCQEIEGGTLGLMHLWYRSGFEVGWGFATAGLGIVILATAPIVLRGQRGLAARIAGFLVLAIAAGFGLRVWVVPEYASYGPQVGFIATALGGLIAAVGDPRLRTAAGQAGPRRQ